MGGEGGGVFHMGGFIFKWGLCPMGGIGFDKGFLKIIIGWGGGGGGKINVKLNFMSPFHEYGSTVSRMQKY